MHTTELAERMTRIELEEFTPIADLIAYHENYGFEFPVRNGHLLNYFSSDGYSVLRDRQ